MVVETPHDKKIDVFRSLAQSRWLRYLIRRFSKKCNKDNISRLEVALELIAGVRENACRTCKFTSSIIRRVISTGAKSFGVSSDMIVEYLSDTIFRKSLCSVIRGLSEFGPRSPFVPGSPFQVVWNITRTCNLHCKHCYENAGRKRKDELTTEQALQCVDNLAENGVVFLALSGGEPTLHPNVLDIIWRANRKGIYVAMATNGITFSNSQVVQFYKTAGLKFVQISLDGACAETHDEFRGLNGAFEKTIQGIRNCVESGLFVEVAMTATHHNFDEIQDVIELCKRLGVKWFMIYNFVPTGRAQTIIDTDLDPFERELLLEKIWLTILSSKPDDMEILTTAPQLGRMAKVNSCPSGVMSCKDSGIVVPTHFSNTRLPSNMSQLSDFIGGCGAGRFYIAIEPNGDIYPCVFFPHKPEVCIGNIIKDDLHQLWKNHTILNELRDKDLLKGSCGNCEHRIVCGGCRARALAYFDDYLGPDPGCLKNIEYWYDLSDKIFPRANVPLIYLKCDFNIGGLA